MRGLYFYLFLTLPLETDRDDPEEERADDLEEERIDEPEKDREIDGLENDRGVYDLDDILGDR